MLLMSIRLLASSGFARKRFAWPFPPVVAAAAVPTDNSVIMSTSTTREAFIRTPPWLSILERMLEVHPQAEADRARNAEETLVLERELVGRLRVDALTRELV